MDAFEQHLLLLATMVAVSGLQSCSKTLSSAIVVIYLIIVSRIKNVKIIQHLKKNYREKSTEISTLLLTKIDNE